MATSIRRGRLNELEALTPDGTEQQQQRIGDGPADWPLTHGTFEMPPGSAWQTNWIATFILLVVIIILAVLAFGFALAGFLKTTHMQKDINDLDKVCLRPDCIGIHKLPISLKGGHCYVLKKNFTIASGPAIHIVGQNDIDLCYANHNILATVPLTVTFIDNSTGIRVHGAYHHSLTQHKGTASRGIRVVGQSTAVYLYSPIMINFRRGLQAEDSDVTITNPYITAEVNDAIDVQGIVAFNVLNLHVQGGFISMPVIVPSSIFASYGISIFNGAQTVLIEGTVAIASGICFDFHAGANGRLSRVVAIQDPLSSPFGSAIQIGSASTFDNMIIQDTRAECSAPGTDCVLLWNARSLIVDGLTVVGSVPPVPDLYTGGMVSVASEFIPGGPPDLEFAAESYDLRHIAIRMTDDTSIGLHINAGILTHKRNMTVSVRDSTIKGGMVGVLFAGGARNSMLQSVTVADAPYCFAAVDEADGVTMKDCDAFRCCLGYWASPLSSAVGVYNSRATRCGTSYSNQGFNCELSTGAGSEGNNRLLAETGDECFLPVLPFPAVLDASVNATAYDTILRMKFGLDDANSV